MPLWSSNSVTTDPESAPVTEYSPTGRATIAARTRERRPSFQRLTGTAGIVSLAVAAHVNASIRVVRARVGAAGRGAVERRCSLRGRRRATFGHGTPGWNSASSGRSRLSPTAVSSAERSEAACAPGDPAPPRERAGLERPADRGSLGRPSAGHGGEGPADVRLAAPQGARRRHDRHPPAGYELDVEPDGLDLHRFERLVSRGARGSAAGRRRESARGARALARPATRRVRLRAVGAGRDRPARGASPRRAPGSDRRGSRARPRRRARRRARAPGRRAPARGATARPAHARPLPLGQAGGGAGRLPVGEGHPGRAARNRAGVGATPPRARDPRPGSGAGRRARRLRRPPARHRSCAHDRPPSSAAAGSSGRFARCWASQTCAS